MELDQFSRGNCERNRRLGLGKPDGTLLLEAAREVNLPERRAPLLHFALKQVSCPIRVQSVERLKPLGLQEVPIFHSELFSQGNVMHEVLQFTPLYNRSTTVDRC